MAQRIPKEFIDSLLEKANITDIINSYIKLEKKGNDYWSRCPFHNEKTSSFSVSENKQFFHCFGCGAHGNAIGFVMEHANKTYPEAIETIANSMGMDIPRDKESNKKYEARKIIHNSLSDACKNFEEQLKNSKLAISYLKKRNILGTTAKLFNIGYAENNFQNLKNVLINSYSESDLLNAGLIAKKDGNSYDKFRDRIMFPIHDASGNIIAFGGRILHDNVEKPLPKYMNSPETILFSKKRVLYNLHLAKKSKEAKDILYIVEGYMDVIALYQAGIKNVVATLGTAVTQENLLQCFKYTKEIICCFDGDKAGEKAAWQGVENIMAVINDGNIISFVFLPENNDPDDIIEKGGINLWEKNINKKISIEEFIFKKFSKEVDLKTAAGKTQFIKKADTLLNKLNAKILKEILKSSLREKIGVKNISFNVTNETILSKPKKIKSNPIRSAILILINYPGININMDAINLEFIKNYPGINLLKEIIEIINNNKNISMGRIIEFFEGTDNYDHLKKISANKLLDLNPGLNNVSEEFINNVSEEFNGYINIILKNTLKDKRKMLINDYNNLENPDSTILKEITKIDKLLKK